MAGERRGVTRSAALSLVAVLLLPGCKEPEKPSDAIVPLVQAGTGIAIANVREIPASNANARSTDEFYVVTFAWTNTLGFALVPKISHFVFVDPASKRFLGSDSGDAALVGISNANDEIKQGESHDYTVGFRVPHATTGKLFYDDSF